MYTIYIHDQSNNQFTCAPKRGFCVCNRLGPLSHLNRASSFQSLDGSTNNVHERTYKCFIIFLLHKLCMNKTENVFINKH